MKYLRTFSLILALCPIISVFSQVQVFLHQPPPGQLNIADLWKFEVLNSTETSRFIKFHATVSSSDGVPIFEGTSANYYISVVSYMYEEDIYLNSEYFKINGKGEAHEVYSPTGNDVFDEDGGSNPYIIPIKWAASGWSNVKITLHYESNFWQTYSIAENTQNDGKYNWTINENLYFKNPSSAYIVISEINSNEEIQSEQFLIYE